MKKLISAALLVFAAGVFERPLQGQSLEAEEETVTRLWRVGAKITTSSRGCRSLLVTFPVPTDWPEQHVNLYEEQIPDEARKADYRILDDGVKQMVANIPSIDANSTVEIYVLMEITVSKIAAPDRTDHLVVPGRVPREVRAHLNKSPLIDYRKIDIKKQVNEVIEDKELAWEQVKGFYDWISENIEIKKQPPEGAVQTIKSKGGCPEDLCNLFIAMCRAHRVPARMVWAENGEYAEFYLEDPEGNGNWYPVVFDGQPEFGSMSSPRVIMQKGDNIKVPEESQRQRLVVELVTGKGGGGRPKVKFVRDLLPAK